MPRISTGIGTDVISGGDSWNRYWMTRKPSNLIVTGQTDTTITFRWSAGVAQPEGYKLKKSTDGINYIDAATVNGATTTAQATGLTAGTLYYFKIVGYKGTNESDPTNIYDTRYKITIDTTKAGSANDTFVLPCSTGTFNYFVDWGDGGVEENVVAGGNKSHQYASSGSYQIKIRGVMPRILFDASGDRLKLITLDNWGNIKWSSVTSAYNGCANMQGTYIDVPNLSSCTALASTFMNCAKFNWNVNNFNTTSITNMSNTFLGAIIFNQSLSNWITANVTTMEAMLRGALVFNQDISHFNIAKVTTMANMLYTANEFSRANYDKLLIAWSAQTVKPNVPFHVGDATYTAGGAVEAARSVLTGAPNSWIISDGGPAFDNGKMVITSDDGYASVRTTGMPALVAKGVSGTFYIPSNEVGTANHVTWGQLQEMHAAGMDMQCHFTNHVDLRTLTEAQIVAGLQEVEADFIANALPAPVHHAYNFGYFNDNVRSWVAEERLTGRTTQEAYTHKNSDKTQIPAFCIDDGYITIDEAIGYLDHAKAEGKAVVMYGHRFGEAGYVNMTELNQIIDYAKSIGIDIITMSQLYSLMS